MRYDLQHVPAPPRPNTATPLLTLYTSTLNIDKNNLAPRLGSAWQPFRNTVVRIGAGTFYGKTSNSTYYALRVENGVFQQTFSGCSPTSTNPLLKGCAPIFPNLYFTPPGPAPAAPFAGALSPVVGIPGGTLPASSAAAHGMTPDFVNPVADEGELSVEEQLPGHMTVSATYLVTRGIHLPASYDANVAPTTQTRELRCPNLERHDRVNGNRTLLHGAHRSRHRADSEPGQHHQFLVQRTRHQPE